MKNLAVTSTDINQRLTIMEWLSIQLIMPFFSFIFVTESDALSYYVIPNEKSGCSDGWSRPLVSLSKSMQANQMSISQITPSFILNLVVIN